MLKARYQPKQPEKTPGGPGGGGDF